MKKTQIKMVDWMTRAELMRHALSQNICSFPNAPYGTRSRDPERTEHTRAPFTCRCHGHKAEGDDGGGGVGGGAGVGAGGAAVMQAL